MKRRKTLLLFGGLLAMGAAVMIPAYIAKSMTRPELRTIDRYLDDKPEPWSDQPFILILGRRKERAGANDPTPHRNSRIGLYKRAKDFWNLVGTQFPVRSLSTSLELPVFENQKDAFARSSGRYGFKSVPFGIFTLVEIPWKNTNRGFLISDYGRTDGIITLYNAQEIYSYTVVEDSTTTEGWRLKVNTSEVRSTWEKRDSTLHPTRTRQWAFADSNGCLNLFQPDDRSDPEYKTSDWQRFISLLDEHQLTGASKRIILVLVPWEMVAGSEPDSMTSSVPLTFASPKLLAKAASEIDR